MEYLIAFDTLYDATQTKRILSNYNSRIIPTPRFLTNACSSSVCANGDGAQETFLNNTELQDGVGYKMYIVNDQEYIYVCGKFAYEVIREAELGSK